jgi:hypothetical protein
MRWVVTLAAFVGGVVGLVVGVNAYGPVLRVFGPPAQSFPLPHQVPKYPGGTSLRLAMVHDVLHERFARHGRAYYEARNRRALRELAELSAKPQDADKTPEQLLPYFDDLGAGLDYLGEHHEAVRVLRDKLARQQARGLKSNALYTTYANLGTFLLHDNLAAAQKGDPKAKEGFREGLGFVQKSIEVNPAAHFGREVWQVVVAEFLLAVMDDPQLLRKYDFVGDRLDQPVNPEPLRCISPAGLRGGFPRQLGHYLRDPATSEKALDSMRIVITQVGAEKGWDKAVRGSHTEPVPFDEPVLGIVGMWRLGGGANPHFALALGEIMLRVGQRYLSWCAFERAAGLEESLWPDPEIRRGFVAHCRARQKLIEAQLPAEESRQLRPRFQAEWAFGQGYQKAYQDYEAERLAAGKALDDPHFYDAFNTGHGPIASPVGTSDRILVAPQGPLMLNGVPLGWGVFFAGLFAFVAAWLMRTRATRRSSPAVPPESALPTP